MQKNEKTVSPVVGEVVDLREQLAQLTSVVATFVAASAAKQTRVSRKAVAVALSPVEGFCAQAGFRDGSARNKLFTELFARGSGEYPLSDFAYATTGDARVVGRRLPRKLLPFSLDVDGEERGAAVLIYRDKRDNA